MKRCILTPPGLLILALAALLLSGPRRPALAQTATPAPLPQSITLTVTDGARTARVDTTAPTLGAALWRAGYRWRRADRLSPPAETRLQSAFAVRIERARAVTVTVDGQSLPALTHAATVAGALRDAGVALVGDDYAVPAPDAPLPAEGVIRVVRVREEFLDTQTLVPFETLYQARADWEIDTVQTLEAGANGILRRRVRARFEDGVEVSRVDEGESLVLAPAPRVIGYGTNIVIRTVETADGVLEYWRSYTMYATSYAAKFLSRPPSSPNYGRTASGKILTKGLVAIDRRYIPFGTRMYVPGYGFAEAADTGGGVKGRWIDLGFDDFNYESWHRVVTVYFLTPAPPADRINWIIPATVP